MSVLLKPMRIGSMVVKNRLVMPPMNTNFSDVNGAVTRQMIDYYVQRARYNIGLVVVESVSVSDSSKGYATQPMISDPKYIPGMYELTDALHAYGAKVSLEITHFGVETPVSPRVGPSALPGREDIHPLTPAEIEAIEDQFVNGALYARQAGFDAVTLHATHGELIAQFLSPLYNTRTDEFGGSLENRSRLLLNIVRKCRAALGRRYPLIVRYSACEFVDGGFELDEAVQLAVELEKAGVDALDISCGVPVSFVLNTRPYNVGNDEPFMAEYCRAIKQRVQIPVLYACGLRDPKKAEWVVESGAADFVCFGRQLIADDAYAQKVSDGRFEDIRYCLSCQQCYQQLGAGRGLRCSVNPLTGREYLWGSQLKQADTPKHILVVGAGAAGLEAAYTAARCGHRVTLCDRDGALGGTLRAAAVPPGKQRIAQLIQWYETQLQKWNVEILLSCPYSEALVEQVAPDAVIMATGSRYAQVIPGSDGEQVLTATEALLKPELVGDNVVVIGGGVSGCETAEYFAGDVCDLQFERVPSLQGGTVTYRKSSKEAAKKRNITVLEMAADICQDMAADAKMILLLKLKEAGVQIRVHARVLEITPQGVAVEDVLTGESTFFKADTVILSAGLVAAEPMESGAAGVPVRMIGDCATPGKIVDAIFEGSAAARHL